MVARSASSFPDSLVDAELFGSAKGYPNPGDRERLGLFGEAEGGTLFLDEVGELPESLQTRLLRVLDDGREYNRLGESKPRRSTARFIAATNRGSAALKDDVLARFKYRIDLPGLNARRSDIPLLVHELLRQRAQREPRILNRFFEPGDPPRPRIQPPLIDALARHHYTSHARELDWLLVIAARTSPSNSFVLTPAVLEELDFGGGAGDAAVKQEQVTRQALLALLEANEWNRNAVARELGITRFGVYSLINKFGLKGE